MAVRSNAIRDPFSDPNQFGNDPVVERTQTHANGLGDISIVPRRWMFDPPTHERYNIALGFGVKLPTGASSVHDTRRIRDTTPDPADTYQTENVVRTVDQSIQPGDGGFGVICRPPDLSALRREPSGRLRDRHVPGEPGEHERSGDVPRRR